MINRIKRSATLQASGIVSLSVGAALAVTAWFTLFVVLMFLCSGCSAAGDGLSNEIDVEQTNTDDAIELQAPLVSQTGPVMFVETERVMYVAPDAVVQPYLEAAIERLTALGFDIVIDPDGIPFNVDDNVPAGSQARTYFKRFCFYDTCTAENTHVKVTSALLTLTPAFIRNSLEHELGHILSGFGGCSKGKHLPMAADGSHLVPGNIISNGNTGYGSFNTTQADFQLMRSCL